MHSREPYLHIFLMKRLRQEPSLYEVLEIGKSASAAEVRKAYYRLSKLHHPDKCRGEADSTHKFQMIAEAYQTLSDHDRRAEYDEKVKYDERRAWVQCQIEKMDEIMEALGEGGIADDEFQNSYEAAFELVKKHASMGRHFDAVEVPYSLARYHLDIYELRDESGVHAVMVMVNTLISRAYVFLMGTRDKVDVAIEKCVEKKERWGKVKDEFPRLFGAKKTKMRRLEDLWDALVAKDR